MKTRKYKVIRNDERIEMVYEDICHALGFIADVEFVKVTTRGTITFTVGTPSEVRSLLSAVKGNGFIPAKSLLDATK